MVTIDTSRYQNKTTPMRIVVVGNPENRRVQFFCNAAVSLNLKAPEIVSYNDILDGKKTLSDVLTKETVLRIESPGENFEVEKKLIAKGAQFCLGAACETLSDSEALKLAPDPGRIRLLRQWYMGFKNLLLEWQSDITANACRTMNSPGAIALMFDKLACQQHLSASKIPVPDILPSVTNYDELRQQMAHHSWNRVFIKPFHSSSASGVIAYRTQGNREQVTTSMELVHDHRGTRFYNALKVRQYNDEKEIRLLIDYILGEGAIVEAWIPKASIQGKFCDIRVVAVNGLPRYVLPRLSSHPITNLHLGNQRGDIETLQQNLEPGTYRRVLQCATDAVRAVPGAFYAGVDILIPAGFGEPRVLELNAFGDLLPGLTYHGDDTYTAILKDFLHAA